jgi:hypothetical protein
MNHILHTPQPGGLNLLNNGGFTGYGRRWAGVPNTADFRSAWAVDNLDMDLYARTGGGFLGDDNQLSGWDVSGVAASLVVSPSNEDGYEITAPDPGNVLQVGFLEDGDIYLTQEITNVKRLSATDASFAFGGVFIKGKPEVALEVMADDELTSLVEVSAATFGAYRRIGAHMLFAKGVASVQVRVRLSGSAGDLVGICGVMGSLGAKSAATQFSSSLADRVVPSGTVYMIAGESCPSGYVEVGTPGNMVHTSGTKSFQSVEGKFVRELGQTEHSHHPLDNDPLAPPTRDSVTTQTPLTSGIAPVSAVQFGDYDPYRPYADEVPDLVLSRSHSHTLQTRMESAPPTFPVRYCGKL